MKQLPKVKFNVNVPTVLFSITPVTTCTTFVIVTKKLDAFRIRRLHLTGCGVANVSTLEAT